MLLCSIATLPRTCRCGYVCPYYYYDTHTHAMPRSAGGLHVCWRSWGSLISSAQRLKNLAAWGGDQFHHDTHDNLALVDPRRRHTRTTLAHQCSAVC
ncbi:hypothetical protein B0T25DRAFT_551666 [Lasiosphaeria hispida]|uniref:Uncharacterized protein n=1 Tax=Lasiosphaeria hispida TaxID=260671 RepID=A0AAJ0HB11_9PEZI|nr:hypothetical protein B0T25DRAFT_551666 [Lasiosphaeria hispida]